MALATVGGTTVLNAAVNFETAAPPSSKPTTETAADRLTTDGGVESDEAYTYHREPARVGGARYVRCTTCRAECVCRRTPRRCSTATAVGRGTDD